MTPKAIRPDFKHLKISITYANLKFHLNEKNGTDLEWIGATEWNDQAKKMLESSTKFKFTEKWKEYLKCAIWDWGERFEDIRVHLENVKNHFQGLGMVSGWDPTIEKNREWVLTETMRRIRRIDGANRAAKKKLNTEGQEGEERQFTREELSKYDGVHDEKVYIAVKGRVYDVSEKKSLYGPGGSYHYLAGRDASRVLALMDDDPMNVINPHIDDLTEEQESDLNAWVNKFNSSYRCVGVLSVKEQKARL